MPKRFAAGARVVVTSALEEARRRGDRRIGTEHLFLGLLHDPDSVASRALGIDLESARAALEALDRGALASIGIDVGSVRAAGLVPSRSRTRIPLTSTARAVLERAAKGTARTRSRRIGPEHMLMALLACEQPDPAAELMAQLGIDRSVVRNRLEKPAA